MGQISIGGSLKKTILTHNPDLIRLILLPRLVNC